MQLYLSKWVKLKICGSLETSCFGETQRGCNYLRLLESVNAFLAGGAGNTRRTVGFKEPCLQFVDGCKYGKYKLTCRGHG